MQRYYFYQKKEQFIDDFLNSVITKLFFIIHNSKDYSRKDTAFLKNFASLLPFWKYLRPWFSFPCTCLSYRWWRWRQMPNLAWCSCDSLDCLVLVGLELCKYLQCMATFDRPHHVGLVCRVRFEMRISTYLHIGRGIVNAAHSWPIARKLWAGTEG